MLIVVDGAQVPLLALPLAEPGHDLLVAQLVGFGGAGEHGDVPGVSGLVGDDAVFGAGLLRFRLVGPVWGDQFVRAVAAVVGAVADDDADVVGVLAVGAYVGEDLLLPAVELLCLADDEVGVAGVLVVGGFEVGHGASLWCVEGSGCAWGEWRSRGRVYGLCR
ncbi:hypothetical protein AB0K74_47075 [Streptomyces sp. NPDC056159]|uniref:hypothetical protein n=1 Tax=Streptomyces sp. NPDC056159 TaxID=3155537 RepID=UPI00343361BF